MLASYSSRKSFCFPFDSFINIINTLPCFYELYKKFLKVFSSKFYDMRFSLYPLPRFGKCYVFNVYRVIYICAYILFNGVCFSSFIVKMFDRYQFYFSRLRVLDEK